jgi:hypothetical protein
MTGEDGKRSVHTVAEALTLPSRGYLLLLGFWLLRGLRWCSQGRETKDQESRDSEDRCVSGADVEFVEGSKCIFGFYQLTCST